MSGNVTAAVVVTTDAAGPNAPVIKSDAESDGNHSSDAETDPSVTVLKKLIANVVGAFKPRRLHHVGTLQRVREMLVEADIDTELSDSCSLKLLKGMAVRDGKARGYNATQLLPHSLIAQNGTYAFVDFILLQFVRSEENRMWFTRLIFYWFDIVECRGEFG